MLEEDETRAWFSAYNEYWYPHIKQTKNDFLVLKTISPEEYIRRADVVAKAAGVYARNKVNAMKETS